MGTKINIILECFLKEKDGTINALKYQRSGLLFLLRGGPLNLMAISEDIQVSIVQIITIFNKCFSKFSKPRINRHCH